MTFCKKICSTKGILPILSEPYLTFTFYLIIFLKKKWANPGLFFVSFWSFQTNITIFTTNICEKCPSSIWCRDLNPRPLECESLPITTRPGLFCCKRKKVCKKCVKWTIQRNLSQHFNWDFVNYCTSHDYCTYLSNCIRLVMVSLWLNRLFWDSTQPKNLLNQHLNILTESGIVQYLLRFND